MSTPYVILIVVVVTIITGFIGLRLRPHELKTKYFLEKWKELQKLLPYKETWSSAIIEADKLLDEALKKKHINGKSMGERLVAVQRMLTNNDGVWFAHKLRNKIDNDPSFKLKKRDVKDALMGFRQALKDVGALPNGRNEDE